MNNQSVIINSAPVELNLYERIIQVYLEVTSVTKDAEVGVSATNSYSAVTHDAVTKALHLPIARAGIVIKPTQKSCVISTVEKPDKYKPDVKNVSYRADVTAEIEFINSKNPSEIMVSSASAYAFDNADKAVGKAYSMAIKMILLKTFMLESLDEEEARPTEENTTYKEQIKIPLKVTPPVKPPEQKPIVQSESLPYTSNGSKIIEFAKNNNVDDMKLKSLMIKKYSKPVDFDTLSGQQCKEFCEFIKQEIKK